MQSDPEKQRAWRERGAKKYAEKQRARSHQQGFRRSEPRDRPKNVKPSTKPRRNDSGWRDAVLALRGRYCRACGSATKRLEIDHVLPRSQGGPSVVENGLPLCVDCHRDKTEGRLRFRFEWLDNDMIAWLAQQGWAVWEEDGTVSGRGWRHFEPRLMHNQ